MTKAQLIRHHELTDAVIRRKIKAHEIRLGGNAKLMIYGRLSCGRGKGMKRANRVFFGSVQEAEALGFRPCGHCLREAYKNWKDGLI